MATSFQFVMRHDDQCRPHLDLRGVKLAVFHRKTGFASRQARQ